jgi:uncharacterized protein YggU (UPF0235/DUF167 family)
MGEGAAERRLPPCVRSGLGFVTVEIVAKPGSSRRGILRREPRGLVIALNSRPSNGRANDELLEFLADLLGTPRSTISILRGHTGRVKTVRIEARDPVRIAAVLQAYS